MPSILLNILSRHYDIHDAMGNCFGLGFGFLSSKYASFDYEDKDYQSKNFVKMCIIYIINVNTLETNFLVKVLL